MSIGRSVARVWSGYVPAQHAESFFRHLLATGVADAAATDGYLGATVLRRKEGEGVRLTLLTLWRDAESVRRFAGDDAIAAVLYPGDEEFELDPDLTASQHDLVFDQRLADAR